eukprot:scaffold1471_cov413-Prasinococcus_capsulatus_cf.AAC.1
MKKKMKMMMMLMMLDRQLGRRLGPRELAPGRPALRMKVAGGRSLAVGGDRAIGARATAARAEPGQGVRWGGAGRRCRPRSLSLSLSLSRRSDSAYSSGRARPAQDGGEPWPRPPPACFRGIGARVSRTRAHARELAAEPHVASLESCPSPTTPVAAQVAQLGSGRPQPSSRNELHRGPQPQEAGRHAWLQLAWRAFRLRPRPCPQAGLAPQRSFGPGEAPDPRHVVGRRAQANPGTRTARASE